MQPFCSFSFSSIDLLDDEETYISKIKIGLVDVSSLLRYNLSDQ